MPGLAVDLRGDFIQFFFSVANQPVADLRHALKISFALLGGFFDLELLQFFFQRARFRNDVFLLLPLRFKRIGFFTNAGQLFLNVSEAFFRIGVILFFQRLLFDFQLRGSPF